MVSMSKHAYLVYPHQLYKAEYIPQGTSTVFVIEDPLYFGNDQQYPVYFHKQKLILHRAAMRRYIEEVLWPANLDVEYVTFDQLAESGDIVQRLHGYERVTMYDVVDDVLQRRLQSAVQSIPEAPAITMLDTPNFYLKRAEVVDHMTKNKSSFDAFYQWQRERFNILIDENYKPVGGKWSYETDSRKRLPADHKLPTFAVFGSNKYVDEARQYIQKHFPGNPGNDENFCWPTNHAEAEQWLKEFLEQRLADFGPYQDAIDGGAPWVYHSAISPMLNCGLLDPRTVVAWALDVAVKKELPLTSVESFVRQVLGWREFMRGMYVTCGVKLRTANVFGHTRKLTQDWYHGTTGILPVDDVVRKVLERGYAHDVERLMIAGNLMLVSQIHPSEVYLWCMELFVDAYDWVVVPNVYGLSQYSDGGGIATKLAASGSDYILQMSHYQKGEWSDAWDGLYWQFLETNHQLLSKNPSAKTALRQMSRIDQDHRRIAGYRADDFLNTKTAAQ